MSTGINNNLYPPVINKSFAPAFVADIEGSEKNCNIPFSISIFNSISNIDPIIQVSIREQNSNQIPKKLENRQILLLRHNNSIVGIPGDYFEIGKFYKIQFRLMLRGTINILEDSDISDEFFDYKNQENGEIKIYKKNSQDSGLALWINKNLERFSEWSEVVIVKRIGKPTLNIANFSNLDISKDFTNLKNLQIHGNITFDGDQSERLKYYQVKILDYQDNILESSNILYNDFSKIEDEINYKTKYSFQEEVDYQLEITYTTTNYYSSSIKYPFRVNFQYYQQFNGKISTSVENNLGRIKVDLINNQKLYETGVNLVIKRATSKTNFKIWQEVFTFMATPGQYLSKTWYDYTIESGVWYKYSIQEQYTENFYSTVVETQYAIMPEFEDIFLVADNKQLKIRFNPSISNYSHVISEGLTQTIGSKYPFITRNGNVNYRSFSLSGLITSFMDIDVNLMKASKNDLYQDKEIIELYKQYEYKNNITPYNNYIQQKEFREQVIDFLYKNNVKLYKSTTEGSFLVKLTNISLTPDETLGRYLYSFSCTVNEIDDFTYENCVKYNIQNDGEFEVWEGETFSVQGQLFIGNRENKFLKNNNISWNNKSYFEQKPIDIETFMNERYEKLSNSSTTIKFQYFNSLKFHFYNENLGMRTDGDVCKIQIFLKEDEKKENKKIESKDISAPIITLGYNGIYEITSNDNIKVTGFQIYQVDNEKETEQTVQQQLKKGFLDIQYEAVLTKQEKEDLYPIKISTNKTVGQFWRLFEAKTSIYDLISKKYQKVKNLNLSSEQRSLTKNKDWNVDISIQKLDGVRVTAAPGTAIYVKEQQDIDFEKFIIGETGVLEFFDDNSYIQDLCFSHIELYPTLKITPRINEFYYNQTNNTTDKENYLWKDDNDYYHIIYNKKEYSSQNNTELKNELEVIEQNENLVLVKIYPKYIEGIVDYAGILLKEEYE